MQEMKPDVVVPPDEELARGDLVVTPTDAQPYKVVFRLGERTISEHPVSSCEEGEDLIKKELPNIRVSARDEGHHA